MEKYISLLVVVFMTLSLCACTGIKTPVESDGITSNKTPEEETKEILAYAIKYDLKINPEFTVYADQNLCVTEITAENEDAENVMADVNVYGLSVSDAFETITDEAKNKGYMTQGKGNTVEITILEKDEEEMPTCHICNGSGTIVCNECDGTEIAGSCDRCKGTGIEFHSDGGPVCPHCDGSGICSECEGSGEVVVTNGEDGDIVYVDEGEPEMGECAGCNGTGVCLNCEGKDYSGEAVDIVCGGCDGTGVLICHDDLNGYIWCPCCWGSGIEGTGNPDYESWMKEKGY